ncbi:MAG TPA: hypothetical protein P5121_19315 [Caldilineaceae bacterium]|nr:hypothetical protein [Caldilineaceae bacterium]
MSIYHKRALYTSDNLRWVERSGWDRFLDAIGTLIAAQSTGTELPTCASTTACSQLPEQLPLKSEIYLPVVLR